MATEKNNIFVAFWQVVCMCACARACVCLFEKAEKKRGTQRWSDKRERSSRLCVRWSDKTWHSSLRWNVKKECWKRGVKCRKHECHNQSFVRTMITLEKCYSSWPVFHHQKGRNGQNARGEENGRYRTSVDLLCFHLCSFQRLILISRNNCASCSNAVNDLTVFVLLFLGKGTDLPVTQSEAGAHLSGGQRTIAT